MPALTHRQRGLATFRFEPTDHPPYDLMEGCIWPELQAYFQAKHGLQDANAIMNFLDTDFRWTFLNYVGPVPAVDEQASFKGDTQSKTVATGPLAQATSVQEVEAYPWPDPAWWQPVDYAAFSLAWPA